MVLCNEKCRLEISLLTYLHVQNQKKNSKYSV